MLTGVEGVADGDFCHKFQKSFFKKFAIFYGMLSNTGVEKHIITYFLSVSV